MTKHDSARCCGVNDTKRKPTFEWWICVCFCIDYLNPAPIVQVMNVENDSILLRRMEFFQQYDIEVWLRKEVSSFSISCLLISSVLLYNSSTYLWLQTCDTCGILNCTTHCRQCQWTQTRRKSHLTMVQSRAMTSSSSQQAAGADKNTHNHWMYVGKHFIWNQGLPEPFGALDSHPLYLKCANVNMNNHSIVKTKKLKMCLVKLNNTWCSVILLESPLNIVYYDFKI